VEVAKRRGARQIWGWLSVLIGIATGFAGVLMAWDARLHNAIVANRVENPWPGYLVAALGVGLVGFGVRWILRERRVR